MRALEETFDVRAGGLLALESNIQVDVEALEATVFLLTVAKCD